MSIFEQVDFNPGEPFGYMIHGVEVIVGVKKWNPARRRGRPLVRGRGQTSP